MFKEAEIKGEQERGKREKTSPDKQINGRERAGKWGKDIHSEDRINEQGSKQGIRDMEDVGGKKEYEAAEWQTEKEEVLQPLPDIALIGREQLQYTLVDSIY